MNPGLEKFYKQIDKLSREQKKIISIGVIVSVFLFSFWAFVYGPQSRKFAAIKKQLSETEAQIKEITDITAGKELNEAVRQLKMNLNEVSSKLPIQDETVIYNLSENAKKLKIAIKQISPGNKQWSKGIIAGYQIGEFPVSLNLVCGYRTLGEYLNILKNDCPILVRVKQLEIQGRGEGYADLETTLNISAYLSKEEK